MKTILATFVIVLASVTTNAQSKPEPIATWVVESKVGQPRKQVVKYYDANHSLLAQDSVAGKKLNLNSPRTREKLNARLTEFVRKRSQSGTLAKD